MTVRGHLESYSGGKPERVSGSGPDDELISFVTVIIPYPGGCGFMATSGRGKGLCSGDTRGPTGSSSSLCMFTAIFSHQQLMYVFSSDPCSSVPLRLLEE